MSVRRASWKSKWTGRSEAAQRHVVGGVEVHQRQRARLHRRPLDHRLQRLERLQFEAVVLMASDPYLFGVGPWADLDRVARPGGIDPRLDRCIGRGRAVAIGG